MDVQDEHFVGQVKRHLLRSRGLDMSGYSESFVMRAIKKRLGRSGAPTQSDYLKLLAHSDDETNQLLGALSINVTEFFRDKGAFDAFSSKVIRPLLGSKVAAGSMLRIWSAGCASGQETYTVAICLAEEIRKMGLMRPPLISVIGTDISLSALGKARDALYTKDETKNLSERLLREYFLERDGGYGVSPLLRRTVRFSRENLLEKPSSRYFDAIVCRNVLIYFSRPMHDVVTMHLWESLRPNGYLMLGRTESLIGSPRAHFDVIDQENRILQRKN